MQKNSFVRFAVALLAISLLAGCSVNKESTTTPNETALAFAANNADNFQKLGLSRSRIEPWEDGMRTTGDKGSFEWWYFDSTLKDGSTLVIVFYTKDSINPNTPLAPRLTIELTRPDKTTIHKVLKVAANDFSAAKEHCDVRIGANTFKGDLHDYTIHVDVEGIKADIKLHGTVPPWRPATGHVFFKNAKEGFFAWLSSVPQGNVEGTISINGQSQAVTGVGYHDHNWGDISMLKVMHNWYWGRAQIGPYSVIASYITTADKYHNLPLPCTFMLARDGKIIADDSNKVKFSSSDIYIDPYTGKPVANVLVYDYNDGANHYRVTFKREKDLSRVQFVDLLHGFKYIMAKLVNFDGAYIRFTGQTTVERFDGDKIVETTTEKAAVWELMYFGHAPKT